MRIDVYDFDGTLYHGDSTVDFVRHCFARHPSLFAALPALGLASLRLLTRRADLTATKSALFSEMARRFDLDAEAARFWAREDVRRNLYPWFRDTPRDLPVVVASASPEFEQRHAAALLGDVTLVCTRCGADGRIVGRNCKGEEKLRRIREAVGEYAVRAMYTDDAKADAPLLAAAEERYLVSKDGAVTRL